MRLPATYLPELRKRIERLNRRVERTGGTGIHLHVSEPRTELNNDGTMRRQMVEVSLTGAIPRLNGYELLARIQHTETGNIIARAPAHTDTELPDSLRTDGPTCDHCHTARRRNDTFVLRDTLGALSRVGRNCLADYIRSDNLDQALAMMTAWTTASQLLDDEDEHQGSGWLPTTRTYLATAISAIRAFGWVSRAAAEPDTGRHATADTVEWLLGPCPQDAQQALAWYDAQPRESDATEADAVLAWADSLTDGNDYLWNLHVACAQGVVSGKEAGLVASAVPSYRREQERQAAAERDAPDAPDDVGELGERREWDLTVTGLRYIDGYYGVTTLILMDDAHGRHYKWFASGAKDYQVGDQLTGKGTIKDRDDYCGQHATVLTRCKFTTRPR